jgi:4-amino-4-deoxy-L-arabinose transferase-like glycosyltransferase
MTIRSGKDVGEPSKLQDLATPAGDTRRHCRTTLWVFLAALLARTVYFSQFATSPLLTDFGVDSRYYLTWASRIATGSWLGSEVFEQGPLYAYFLGIGSTLIGMQVPLVLLGQMLTGALTCVLIFLCCRRLFDGRTAAVAGFAAALYGPFIFYECTIMKTFLSPLAVIAVLYAALRSRDGKPLLWPLLCGLFIGLACLVRESHLLMVVPVILWVWTGRTDTPVRRRRKLVQTAVVLAGITFCLVPSTVRNWIVGKEFVVVTAGGGEVFYIAQVSAVDGFYSPPPFVLPTSGVEHADFRREAERRTGRSLTRGQSSRYWFDEGVRAVRAKPIRAIEQTVRKVVLLLNDYEAPDNSDYHVTGRFVPILRWGLPTFGWLAGLGVLGIFLCCCQWRRYQLLIGLIAVQALPVIIYYDFGRFRLGMLAVWIPVSIYAFWWLINATQRLIVDWHRHRESWQPIGRTAVLWAIPMAVTCLAFTSFLPPTAEFPTRLRLGLLANKSGDYALAERELRQLLQLYTAYDMAAPADRLRLAGTHQELAKTLCRTERFQEALNHLREARELDLRLDTLHIICNYQFEILHEAVQARRAGKAEGELRKEIDIILAELRSHDENSLRLWAMSSLYAESAADMQFIDASLNRSWQGADQANPLQTAYYRMALAALAEFRGDSATARDEAERALALWPQHEFRAALETFTGKNYPGQSE